MAKLGDVYEDLVLDAVFAHYDTFSLEMWFAMYIDDPLVDPTAEVTTVFDANYVRMPLDPTRFAPSSGGVTSYLDVIEFPVTDADWPVVKWWAVMGSETGQTEDDLLFRGRLSNENPPIILSGTQARFRPGSWTITLD